MQREGSPQHIFDELNRVRNSTPHRQESRMNQVGTAVITDDVTAKVIEDIQFLRDRIAYIKRSDSATNTAILETYENMLESRESVLAIMQKNELDKQLNNRYSHYN